jgi:hypothetical protein
MKNPCYGCQPPKRNAECHSTCKEYTDWRIEHEAERDKRNSELEFSWGLNDIRDSAVRRARRKQKSRS